MAAGLRMAMDAAFWDTDVSTPATLSGTARAVPGDPPPPPTARSSRVPRLQQLSLFCSAFPLGVFPAVSPASAGGKDLGSFCLQSLLLRPSTSNLLAGLVGQLRPMKLISNIKKEVMSGDELEIPAFRDVAKHFKDKSLYAIGLLSQISLSDSTTFHFNAERDGEKNGRRTKAILHHELKEHDITLEAAWPELYVDKKGTYWEVPASASLDISSAVYESGLRYRFGLQRNSGNPEALNSSSGDVSSSLLPGLCARAAFSYEKSKDLWREREKMDPRKTIFDEIPTRMSSYDVQLQEPHSAISGVVGGTCAAWFDKSEKADTSFKENSGDPEVMNSISINPRKRNPLTADLFGSVCYTYQHGKFKKDFNDLTRLDAQLDICSALSFLKGAHNLFSNTFKGRVDREVNPLASPKLNVLIQQQLAGPIVFRMDSSLSLSSPSGKRAPHIDDVIYGLSYSLRLLRSGKILAWYSPKRKEAMVELRMFEF